MKKRLIFSFLLLMTLCLTFAAASFAEGTEGGDTQYTVSFEMNGGSVAFDVSWKEMGLDYPTAWPMEDEQVTEGSTYTVPECTIIPPDWKMFDHWEMTSNGATVNFAPGDSVSVSGDMVFTPIWTDRTFTAAEQFGTLTQGIDDPPSFFVHNFLIPYIPADMVPYTARGNKNPYVQNIYIYWYRVVDGVRGELASSQIFATPSESAPGGAYFQALAPGEVGDYELVITYKGTEVLNQFWSMVEGPAQGGHNYSLRESLSKTYDGNPVDFDPDKMLLIDKGMTSWGVLEKNKEADYTWRMLDGKEYAELAAAPADVGQYQLVILEMGDKGYEEAAAFDFEITEAKPALSLAVSPEKPALGQPFTISWEINLDSYEKAGISGLMYIGNMLKYIQIEGADPTNQRTGSVELTLTEGEDLELRLWADDSHEYQIIHFTGTENNPHPIEAAVSYQKESAVIGEKITASYEITGGSGSYESIEACWVLLGEEYSSEELSSLSVSEPSGQLEYICTRAGRIGLVFRVTDQAGWMYDQDLYSGSTFTVEEPVPVLQSNYRFGAFSLADGTGKYYVHPWLSLVDQFAVFNMADGEPYTLNDLFSCQMVNYYEIKDTFATDPVFDVQVKKGNVSINTDGMQYGPFGLNVFLSEIPEPGEVEFEVTCQVNGKVYSQTIGMEFVAVDSLPTGAEIGRKTPLVFQVGESSDLSAVPTSFANHWSVGAFHKTEFIAPSSVLGASAEGKWTVPGVYREAKLISVDENVRMNKAVDIVVTRADGTIQRMEYTPFGTVAAAPADLTVIESQAFADTKLTEIDIPAGVSIADDAFDGTGLVAIYAHDQNTVSYAVQHGYVAVVD